MTPLERRPKWGGQVAAAACLLLVFTALTGCRGPAGPDGDDAVLADSLDPVVEWLTPPTGSTADTAVTLTARGYDLVGGPGGEVRDTLVHRMVFYIAGEEYPAALTDTAGRVYTYRWVCRYYPEAPYPLMARVWDGALNMATTPAVIVNVSHNP